MVNAVQLKCPHHGRECRDCAWWDGAIAEAEAERDWPW